jgi:hypothetical protein
MSSAPPLAAQIAADTISENGSRSSVTPTCAGARVANGARIEASSEAEGGAPSCVTVTCNSGQTGTRCSKVGEISIRPPLGARRSESSISRVSPRGTISASPRTRIAPDSSAGATISLPWARARVLASAIHVA